MKKKGDKEEIKKAVPDGLFFLGQARKYANLATKALKRGDDTEALTYTMNATVFLDLLNDYINEGRVPKPNWFLIQVKKALIRLQTVTDAVPDEQK
ncbi:MAG: hypothetical protein WC831_01370 [Parcubacteria group bacterium]